MLTQLNKFLKNVYLDYREVFRDVQRASKQRPFKASVYGASLLFILNLYRTNEDLRGYHSEITWACNRVGSVTESSRNPKANTHVQKLGELKCQGLLRQCDLGFSTLVYRADTNPENALFRYNCKFLRPSIKEFFQERLVDWGLLGHWLVLETKMRNYDVNDGQFTSSSLTE